MASQGLSSLYGMGWLFGTALLTSLLWYLFWTVLFPVELDISDLINWYYLVYQFLWHVQADFSCRYFFIKLRLSREYDIYGVLKVIHNWMPLLVITSLILSKASLVYRDYLLKISQVQLHPST